VPDPQQRCRLILLVQSGAGARERLAAALEATDIASVIIKADDAEAAKPLIAIAQKAGAAALLADDPQLARTLKADGVHLPVEATVTLPEALPPPESLRVPRSAARVPVLSKMAPSRCIVGADAGRSRDAAMRLGEAGAEYIGFGIPEFVGDTETARARQLELIGWWAEIFQVPCVAFDVETASDAEALAQAGADFIAVRLAPTMPPAEVRTVLRDFLAALSVPAQ